MDIQRRGQIAILYLTKHASEINLEVLKASPIPSPIPHEDIDRVVNNLLKSISRYEINIDTATDGELQLAVWVVDAAAYNKSITFNPGATLHQQDKFVEELGIPFDDIFHFFGDMLMVHYPRPELVDWK